MTKVKVTCKRCSGTGRVGHSTRCDGVCFNCRGVGHYFRKPPTKRLTAAEEMAEHFAAINARNAERLSQSA
jgi:DnaJ-class molecular chaperone